MPLLSINTMLRLLFVSLLIPILSSCIAPALSNVGRTALTKDRIAIDESKNNSGLLQTNDAIITYTFIDTADAFSISGTVHIKDNVTASFPRGDYFHLYLNFIDNNNIGISTHNISPLLRYRADIDKELPFNYTLTKPADAAFFAFSYMGNFQGAFPGDENMGDWEIFYRPFTRTQ